MTKPIFLTDPYARQCHSKVTGLGPNGGIVVDRSIFFAAGGGQPSDNGNLVWAAGSAQVVDVKKVPDGKLELILDSETNNDPAVGESVEQELNWLRRLRHMRIHTALHILSVAIPLPVTSGAITEEKGRLDFDMPEPIEDRDRLVADLNELVARNLPVTEDWITDEELENNPTLVKTMSVKPPMGNGRVRLIRIGQGQDQIDLQPCGGTHVANTSEVGTIRLGKIGKKGRQNRRVNIFVD